MNELRVGITQGERIFFGQGRTAGRRRSRTPSGYAIDFDANIGLTNWHTRNTLSGRSAYQYTFDETLTWQKGKHSVTFGGGAFLGRAWDDSQQQVTGINLRFDTTNDPAAGLFTTTNFPGASAAQLTDARDLYALLTGRVGSVTGLAALDPETNTYALLGKRRRAGQARQLLGLRPGLVAPDADADAQRRPALGRADAVRAGQRHDVGRDARVDAAASRASATAASTTRATSSRRARAAASSRSSSSSRAARAATTPTGTTSRRTSAWRGGRTSRAAGCARSSAIPSRRRSAAATRWPTTARASASSPASSAPIPAARSA